ncbi:MAG: archease [Candidatus Lokiarchaeota archaeon]|nr:archease [Candidatus Lokiarchaeota archaeon]
MKVGYKFLDHKSDLYIRACGKDLNQAFEQSGLAVCDAMVEIEKVEPKVDREVSVESEDIFSLLYDYLEELLFLFDTEFLLFSEIEIKINEIESGFRLDAKLYGEEFDEEKHSQRIGIKSPTYSLMEKIEKDELICLEFVMDI